jgi:hypothetical protein
MAFETPQELRREANDIASRSKGARQAWFDLRQWATGRGPIAMKTAVHEFLSVHGGAPDSTILLPEILRGISAFPPQERGAMIALATKRPGISDFRHNSMISPRASMVVSNNRPTPAMTFHPSNLPSGISAMKIPGRGKLAEDPSSIRDMPMHMHELHRPAIGSTMLRAKLEMKPAGFDSSRSPDSLAMGMDKGEHIVRSLVHNMRSHGGGNAPYLGASAKPKSVAVKASRAKKKATPRKSVAKARHVKRVGKTMRAKGAGKQPRGRSAKKKSRKQ